jgi:serine/threonine-protein kinase HipA
MKLAPGTPLSISLALDPARKPLQAGRLAMDRGLAQLEWSPDVIAAKLAIDPYLYPPLRGVHAARGREFMGLHGFLSDSLPDGWGYIVMRRRLAKLGVDIATLSPLERLALVGEQGRGALVYTPVTTPSDEAASLDLDALAAESAALIAGEESSLADTLARLAGGSGGARPKVHVGFDSRGGISVGAGEIAQGHTAWLVKFRAPEDAIDIGPLEEAYAAMAEASGLTVSEHRLIPANNGHGYFATRRFDRPDNGSRLHMVSLAGAIEARPDVPSIGYDMFLRATRAITRRADDVRQAFRRMVFNVLAHNRDDHTRQQAYLMDARGDWRLAPAYDLTFAPGPGGEHYQDIEGEGRRPTRAHVAAVGARHSLSDKQVSDIIEEVRAALADWEVFARAAGVTATSTNEAKAAHERVWRDFTAS